MGNMPMIPKDLPESAKAILERISNYDIIGASLCIRYINEALSIVAAEYDASTPDELIAKLTETQQFLCELKPNTAAYFNVTQWVIEPFRATPMTLDELRQAVVARCRRYDEWSRDNVASIAVKGATLLPDGGRILTHDYSSTVMAVLASAKAQGKTLGLVVTEGRPVDQAVRILKEASKMGHRLMLVPDTAIGRAMPDVDAVLVGVECLFENGDLLNTVGTLPIALAAREYGVPVYAPTEIVKIHPHIPSGKAVRANAEVLRPWFLPERLTSVGDVHVDNKVLDVTPASLISAYITERGVVSPSSVWLLIREFTSSLRSLAEQSASHSGTEGPREGSGCPFGLGGTEL